MAPAGSAMSGFFLIAMPLMMLVTAIKALVSAARKPTGGRTAGPRALVIGLGALSCGVGLWSQNILLSQPFGTEAYGAELLPWLALDLCLLAIAWALIARVVIHFARRLGPEE